MFGRSAAKQVDHTRDVLLNIIEEDKKRLQFTPDYQEISQQKSRLLFIHDDMMQLLPNHDLVKMGSLSGFYPFAYGYTAKRMSFVKKELGLKSFPIALSIRDRDNLPNSIADEYRIRGEVYAVRPQQFISLDTHRQNGVQFQRVKVNINLAFKKVFDKPWVNAMGNTIHEYILGREEMITQEMFMYIGREEYWKDQLEHTDNFFTFSPVDIVTEDRVWLKEYYQYNRR